MFDKKPVAGVDSDILNESIWKVRWGLFKKGFKKNWSIFCERKIGLIGIGIIVLFLLMTIAHPIWMRYLETQPVPAEQAIMYGGRNITLRDVYHPTRGNDFRIGEDMMPPSHPLPPSLSHPLGTDPMGRDILSQIMYSTRIEFSFGVLSALIGVIIATLVGTVAAYYGGKVDAFFMRFADLVMTFPFLPFLIFLSSMVTLDLFTLGIVIGLLSGFGGPSIILKSQALSVKIRPYIEAAEVSGGSPWHIMTKHIIPNILPLSFLYLMMGVTSAVMSEATLSFLGLLNADISWGIIMDMARTFGYSFYDAWWLYVAPGVTITLFCGAFYLVGRGMDPIINPKLRKR
ncbi:ABC transporter permease [Natronospora cellulosivora (SeqCode)]